MSIDTEAKLTQALRVIQAYETELKKVAEESTKLVNHLQQRQLEGDRLRSRLGKMTAAYQALVALYNATVAQVPEQELHKYRTEWSQAILKLDTLDG